MGCETNDDKLRDCRHCISNFLKKDNTSDENIGFVGICLHQRYINKCPKGLDERAEIPNMREVSSSLSLKSR